MVGASMAAVERALGDLRDFLNGLTPIQKLIVALELAKLISILALAALIFLGHGPWAR
jgi:hypothetical protein